MDTIKEAFTKVKRDIDSLHFELDSLKNTLNEVNWRLGLLSKDMENIKNENVVKEKGVHLKTPQETFPTHQQRNPTHLPAITTNQHAFKAQKGQIWPFSTGNEGVPTDRQTNRQTDQQTQKYVFDESLMVQTKPKTQNPIQSAAEILDSLDSLKKEIRLKFKRLTEKEILVFSTLYHLDEEKGFADYKTLASKLGLTESSIRDYVGRLIDKGIPVDKKKINNKSIQLSISQDLKKVASLSTILQLIKI